MKETDDKQMFNARIPKELIAEIRTYYKEMKVKHGTSYTYTELFTEFMGWVKESKKMELIAEKDKLEKMIEYLLMTSQRESKEPIHIDALEDKKELTVAELWDEFFTDELIANLKELTVIRDGQRFPRMPLRSMYAKFLKRKELTNTLPFTKRLLQSGLFQGIELKMGEE